MKFKVEIYKAYRWILIASVAGSIVACRPDGQDEELGPAPAATFTATPLAENPNKIVFQKTSQEGFMYTWDFGNGVKTTVKTSSSIDTIHYVNKGEYEAFLTVYGKGGSTVTKRVISIANDDLCSGEALTFLTGGCADVDGKTWVLAPKAGSLVVGPPDGSVWWSSGAGDVGGRPCMFNDEYTFRSDGKEFSLTRNMNGDFWVDEEAGQKHPSDMPSIGCHTNSEIPSKYDGWKDASLDFEILGDSLTLTGTGAYMGLYKAGDKGTVSAPENKITYFIEAISDNELVLVKKYDWGYWKFTFSPKGAAPVEPETGINILKGSEMNTGDAEHWTAVNFAANPATAAFGTGGALKLSSETPDVNVMLYQAVEVEAGKEYKLSATIKADGLVETWIEFYFLDAAPTSDPAANGKFLGWSTWCGGAGTINGNITEVECDGGGSGNGDGGSVTFSESKTVYFGFKAGMTGGGSWGANGVTFDNVKLLEVE